MVESEHTVQARAKRGEEIPKRVCGQLIADPARYSLWRVRHGKRMLTVAERRRREQQIVALRAEHLQQIHRTALVRYLRQNQVTGDARDMTLREFYGVIDPARAALAEHKSYIMSASSQLCAWDLLRLVNDRGGLEMLQEYQGSYGQYFAMFCDRARATRNRAAYILNNFIDDAKGEADAIRERILGGERLPAARVAIKRPFRPGRPPSRWV